MTDVTHADSEETRQLIVGDSGRSVHGFRGLHDFVDFAALVAVPLTMSIDEIVDVS